MLGIRSALICLALLPAVACGPGSEAGAPGAGSAAGSGSGGDLPAAANAETGAANAETGVADAEGGPADTDRAAPAPPEGSARDRASTADPRQTAGGGGGRPSAATYPERGHAWVVFGTDTVRAEVARTPEQRSRGLMHRPSLPEDGGMLFVYESEGVRSFWMQNTLIPLDIAFLDSSLRVVDIQSMEPGTTEMHESRGAAMFALEVERGWFAGHDVRVGDEAEIVFGAR